MGDVFMEGSGVLLAFAFFNLGVPFWKGYTKSLE